MYDLLSASDGLIGNGDGLVNVNGSYESFLVKYVNGLSLRKKRARVVEMFTGAHRETGEREEIMD
jgi:hypothetical protein